MHQLNRHGSWNDRLSYAHVLLITIAVLSSSPLRAESPTSAPIEPLMHRGELLNYPGVWSFMIGKSSIILVSDEQLDALSDPERKINLSISPTPHERSLREICEQARAAGHRTLIIAFDHFFSQYRPGQGGKPRRLTPDKPEYIERIAAISKFAAGYGLGLELSLLSPLEIGPAYTQETGESGLWMHYRKGIRDPQSGQYSVQLWRQRFWANNKGTIQIQDAGVRIFAFREKPIHGTPYLHVVPEQIVDITDTAKVEIWPGATHPANQSIRVRIHGEGGPPNTNGFNRVLVVQLYRTPEMDYFSDNALPYLKRLVDRYVDAGVKLNALYSDEMHIQQDWGYHSHHDNGEFAVRYVSPGMAKQFAASYGKEYADFAKYLVYFTCGQEDTTHDLSARDGVMHVMSSTPEGIRATALFRSRYYRLLQDGVVDLFTGAKHHMEQRLGHRLETRAHATWAQSPTCDRWRSSRPYEYTSDFVWSNTVQQAASACHDYFKWGDFLSGNGNDVAEGGFLDRNYYGLALACSTGIINEIPNSYAAHWGMPDVVSRRRQALANAYGDSAWGPFAVVQNNEHRDVEVLMLYPLDLVATEERFGSWMTQYGYANYITAAQLLKRGKVSNGAIQLAGRRFTTLVALFEPFPSRDLLDMMRRLSEGGGRVIWSGPPPLLFSDSTPAQEAWQTLTGVAYSPSRTEGTPAPGKQVTFSGVFAKMSPMPILTDFLVDHTYSLTPREGTESIAHVMNQCVGSLRLTTKGGSVTVLGFRPRDDQSASLGNDDRYWFDILTALGAYPPTQRFAGMNDSTEYLSRTTPYLYCRFPNGAIAIAPHLRDLEENWHGGFIRNQEQDQVALKNIKLPSEHISLLDFRINGHTVTYEGDQAVTFRINSSGQLVSFAGIACKQITIDGQTTTFSDQPLPLVSFAPVAESRRTPGGAVQQILVHGSGTIRIPATNLPTSFELIAEGEIPGSHGASIPFKTENNTILFSAGPNTHRWLYVVPVSLTK